MLYTNSNYRQLKTSKVVEPNDLLFKRLKSDTDILMASETYYLFIGSSVSYVYTSLTYRANGVEDRLIIYHDTEWATRAEVEMDIYKAIHEVGIMSLDLEDLQEYIDWDYRQYWAMT